MTNYEKEFQKGENVCGEPFAEIRTFLENWDRGPADLLDLGCGQGRDALLAARHGFRVTGVDIAPTGIKQMMEQARNEDLEVIGIVADIVDFEPHGDYDIVLIDRVLHMLETDEMRLSVLEISARHTLANGFILIADTSSNMSVIDGFFQSHDRWIEIINKGGFRFLKNTVK